MYSSEKEILKKVSLEKSAIEKAVKHLSIPKKLVEVAQEYGNLPVFSGTLKPDYSEWQTYTFADLKTTAFEIAAGLLSLGVNKGDIIQIIASPRIEHHLIDYGILCSGAIACSLYRQLKVDDLSYIESLTQSKFIFVGKTSLLKEFLKIDSDKTSIQHIIVLEIDTEIKDKRIMLFEDFIQLGKSFLEKDSLCVENLIQSIDSNDTAEIIFTSGTTGPPKGVMLSHCNILSNSYATFHYLQLPKGLTQLSFLPLAHVMARNAEQYSPLFSLFHIYCVADLNDVKTALNQVKPDLFCAVPRLFEKIQAGLLQKIKESGKDKVFMFGLRNALSLLEEKIQNKRPPIVSGLINVLYKKFIFSKILNALGLENLKFVVTGGGAMNPSLQKWFSVLGIDIVQGYGLTESSPVISVQIPKISINAIENHYQIRLPKIQSFGSTGIPLAGTEIKIKGDGEIAVKGLQIFQGYFKKPDETAKVFDEENWFLTGDYGRFTDFGELIISGRKKELLVTTGGKNISPLKVENLIKKSPLVSQAIAIGDNKPFVTAILSIDQETSLKEWANVNGWEYDLKKLAQNPALIYEIESHILSCNQELQSFETIKKFILVSEEWSPENGLLTPTMKMKRNHIHTYYKAEIQKLYSDEYIQMRLDMR